MKSKLLQLQSNKSKRSSKNDENNTKKVLLFYVLYLFHGNVSGVVPLVAGWRETKLNCTIGLLGEKTSLLVFSPSLNYINVIITVTPKIVILALFGGSRLCSVSGLWHPLDSQSGQSVVESEWGEVGECPLSASLLWSSGCRAAAPQRSTSSWAPLDRLSVWREKQILRDWPITALCRTHGISNRGPLPLDPAVILPSPPPPISHFFDTKITLAGRCNSHISGIFASVLCIFWKRSFDFFFPVCYIVIFIYMQWSTKYWLLN